MRADLEAVPDPVWLYEPETERLVWANAAGLRFWGADGQAGLQLQNLNGSWRAAARAKLTQVVNQVSGGAVALEHLTVHPEGRVEVSLHLLVVPCPRADAPPALLCRAEVQDPQARPPLSRGEEALKHTGIMVSVCALDGRLLMENAAAQSVYNLTQSPPTDAVTARFKIEAEGRRARAELERGQPFSKEVAVQTQRGIRWHAVGMHVCEDPVTGLPCVIIDEQDVTTSKAHEHDLEASRTELMRIVRERTQELAVEREHFDQVFDSVGALIVVADLHGTILRANQWSQSLLPASTLVGQSVSEACGFPSEDTLERWALQGTAPSDAVEVILQTRGGRKLHILWTPRLSTSRDGRPRLLLTGLDITELREVESHFQVTDRMATMGTLAAGVAHDLNNPLAYLISNAEIMLEQVSQLPGRSDLETMTRDCLDGARRAAAIVAQLQAFAQGSESPQPRGANLAKVVEFAARMADNQVKHRAQVQVDCPSELFAAMDDSSLGLVVLNLLVHATDNLPDGRAHQHHVQIQARDDGPDWVSLTVHDDGPGTRAEALKQIFDPYAGPHTPPRGMTGLGLAISHRLIVQAGGRVEVDSEQGRGTSVRLWLPRAEGPAPKPTGSPCGANTPTGTSMPGAKARVLVVDDEVKLRTVIRRVLAAYEVEEAGDGREALNKLAEGDFDLILCDVMMPEMTGVELYQRLEAERPELAQRLIFLSGGAFTEETARFLRSTQRVVLDKPFHMAALREAVDRAVSTARMLTGF